MHAAHDRRFGRPSDQGQLSAEVSTPAKPKLLDRLAQALRSRHYSRRTEETYCHWVKRFIFFHHVRHPAEMGEPEINVFLTDNHLIGDKWLMASLMYGAGLRLMECLRLRVQDIDFSRNEIKSIAGRMDKLQRKGGIMWTSPFFRRRSNKPLARRASPNGQPATHSAIPLPHICSKAAMTSEQSKNCSATTTCEPR